jgi:putative N-acetyltransferase (TIGR04045 family)
MIFEPFKPFVASQFQVKRASAPWEINGSFALRRKVFCEEQGLFDGSDRDAIDETAIPLVALSLLGIAADEVVGTVRIHQQAPGLWWGSRLAVSRDYRRVSALGAGLIRLAVCTATARGCHTFLAHVQSQNVPLFERLHWHSLGEQEFHGRPHHKMQADLAFYPPFPDADTGFLAMPKQAA